MLNALRMGTPLKSVIFNLLYIVIGRILARLALNKRTGNVPVLLLDFFRNIHVLLMFFRARPDASTSSAVNTRLPSEALAKDGLKDFFERSKKFFWSNFHCISIGHSSKRIEDGLS